MCTISFLPTATGYRLAMNRDEKRARVRALPPEIFQIGDRRAIFPREPGGGTWLAVNDAGLCLALINWHRIEHEPDGTIESRGRIIPALIGAANSVAIDREFGKISLQNVRPFRLIAIESRAPSVTEWRWDLKGLVAKPRRWEIQHWFSSGYDEREAEKERAQVCATWSLGATFSSLKRLHRSHLPRRGPFSICMHRPDASTVSYSEVVVSARRVTFRYQSGPPCEGQNLRRGTAFPGSSNCSLSFALRLRCKWSRARGGAARRLARKEAGNRNARQPSERVGSPG